MAPKSNQIEELRIEPVPYADRLMLDEAAAADMLSVSRDTIRRLPIMRITIPGTRCVRYRMSDLEMYVRDIDGRKAA